jgi:hypothetical protein
VVTVAALTHARHLAVCLHERWPVQPNHTAVLIQAWVMWCASPGVLELIRNILRLLRNAHVTVV